MTAEARPVTSCYDILDGVDGAIREKLVREGGYFVLGGIVTEALRDAGTTISPEQKTVVANPALVLPTIREGGTLRDIDILVPRILEPGEGAAIKRRVCDAIENQLEVSVFGMELHRSELSRSERMALSLKDWVSHRTIDQSGTLRYELFPFEVSVPPESYEAWQLQLPNGSSVPMLHPAGHVMAYAIRSIAGVRFKDAAKVAAMQDRVLPQFANEIEHGRFTAWAQLAKALEALREKGIADNRMLRPGTTEVEVQQAAKKARAMYWLEHEHPGVINRAQGRTVQKILKSFVRSA